MAVEVDATIRVIIDLILLAISPIPSLIFKVAVTPFRRGFFCNDESINHPYMSDTVPLWCVIVVGMAVPCILMIPIEITRFRRQAARRAEREEDAGAPVRYTVFSRAVHPFIVEIYKAIGPFLFAVAVTQVSTDIIKYSVGRLRPHFLTVCKPDWAAFNCTDAYGNYQFITADVCTGTEHVKEARLSHPSGHSSQAFNCAVYFAIYVQWRLTWRGSRLLRYFIQAAMIYTATYVCTSRISDYKHHWSDVLAGAVMGIIIPILVSYFVSDLFIRPKPKEMKKRLDEMASFCESHRTYTNQAAVMTEIPPQDIGSANGRSKGPMQEWI